jgi:glutamyl-Q tRNA(Asp) synthetase
VTREQPVFRFAPSPNGPLHLGHALSALVNARAAEACGGRFLLRIEDIDPTRCRPEHEAAIFEDLAWLGLTWETPVRRQSQHMADYRAALARLEAMGLIYPCFCSRREIAEAVARHEAGTGAPWPRDPDGAPIYPGTCRELAREEGARRIAAGEPHALRLDMGLALARIGRPLAWVELAQASPGTACHQIAADPAACHQIAADPAACHQIAADPAAWGDVILARRETPTSYHLSVVVDDALQGVTHVVRGQDLFAATAVHRLLQELLGLPAPLYRHHGLIRDEEGRKLSKSLAATGLAELRRAGVSPEDICSRLGCA